MAKIGDVGLAKMVDHGVPGQLGVGTDGYKAPEMYGGGSGGSTPSDMFSFGIILSLLAVMMFCGLYPRVCCCCC